MMLEQLAYERVFNVFVPDITMEEARKNEPYVLRIQVKNRCQFLDVIHIASPLSGLGPLAGSPQVAYAFLTDTRTKEECNYYITAVFSEHPFPWSMDEHTERVRCSTLGITTHSGVPLLHVRVEVQPADYELFEEELGKAGYRLVNAKPYAQSEALLNLYKQHGSRPPSP